MINLFTWFENLYQTKKWLFYVLAIVALPVFLLYLYTKFSIIYQVGKANTQLTKQKETDQTLIKKEEINKDSADLALKNVSEIEKQIENVSVDADWNLKK